MLRACIANERTPQVVSEGLSIHCRFLQTHQTSQSLKSVKTANTASLTPDPVPCEASYTLSSPRNSGTEPPSAVTTPSCMSPGQLRSQIVLGRVQELMVLRMGRNNEQKNRTVMCSFCISLEHMMKEIRSARLRRSTNCCITGHK